MPYSPRDDSPDSRGRYESPTVDSFGREIPSNRGAIRDRSRSRSRRRSFSRSESHSEERRDRNDSYRSNRRYSRGGGYGGGYRSAPRQYKSLKPHVNNMSPMQTYKSYLVSLSDEVEPATALEKYNQYVVEYNEKAADGFFQDHIRDEWFRERYFDEEMQAKINYLNLIHDKVIVEIKEKTASLNCLQYPRKPADGEDKTEIYNEPNILFLQLVPPTVTRDQFEALFSSYDGYIESYFSDPSQFPPKYFFRFGWIVFDTRENAAKVLDTCAGQHMTYTDNKDFIFSASINKSRPPSVLPSTAQDRLDKDFLQIKQLISALEEQRHYTISFESLLNEEGLVNLPIRDKIKICVYYLKRVFLYSYYSGVQYFDYGQILFSEGPYYLYKDEYHESTSLEEKIETETTFEEEGEVKITSFKSQFEYPDNWEAMTDNNFQNRLAFIPKINELLGVEFDVDPEALELTFYEKNIQRATKENFGTCYACIFCEKKFEEKKFAEKHQKNKHNDLIDTFIQQEKYTRKAKHIYSNDPYRNVPIEKERPRRSPSTSTFGNSTFSRPYRRRGFKPYRDPDDMSMYTPSKNKTASINYGDI